MALEIVSMRCKMTDEASAFPTSRPTNGHSCILCEHGKNRRRIFKRAVARRALARLVCLTTAPGELGEVRSIFIAQFDQDLLQFHSPSFLG